MRRAGLGLLLALIAACGRDEPASRPDPIVVYAPGDEGSAIAALIEEFTGETNIPVSVKWGPSADNTDAVISKSGIPADILVTDNAADIWHAAEEGALRPIESPALDDVSDLVKDRDRYWTAIRVYPALLVGSAEGAQPDDEAAVPCVMTSAHPLSRSLIANRIQADGLRDAERAMRRMVAALEQEPFPSEEALVEAIRRGTCKSGIATGRAAGDLPSIPARNFSAVAITAVGVGRHARYPESAQRFVDWLLRERPVAVPESVLLPVSISGYRDEEARLLAERAGYR